MMGELADWERQILKDVDARAPKWERVKPGTVIPAGQPYRMEWDGIMPHQRCAAEYPGRALEWEVEPFCHGTVYDRMFVDSSWRPPLVLPTEPTWGIVIICDGPTWRQRIGQWALVGSGSGRRLREQRYFNEWRAEWVRDFIPLTEEQVQRIEAAR